MKKFIYCEEKDRGRFLKEGLNFICTQELGNKEYFVFENDELKTLTFDTEIFVTSDKMYF
ncbi:hypothetical protein [Clostridium tagluense]|uniref:Uncharacterized protein n=1 Tax=Clostridium tagluense TaxID=360422 RepID=A0A401ULM8_9CLOT|nr:hypothetical protein [Clostridium tagluense]GCD10432.1 hypothetical protein Ctaglu_20550 [Clostridium tagluense]